jgi:hypothetical protein
MVGSGLEGSGDEPTLMDLTRRKLLISTNPTPRLWSFI